MALGRGPAKLFIYLAFYAWSIGAHKRGWMIGPITEKRICGTPDCSGYHGLGCSEATFRMWRGELIEAGLLRVTITPGKSRGHIYELLGDLPTRELVYEYLDELGEEERIKYGSCEKCGEPRTLLQAEDGTTFVGCPRLSCDPDYRPSKQTEAWDAIGIKKPGSR